MTTDYAERVAGDIGQYIDIQIGGLANLNGITAVIGRATRRGTTHTLDAAVQDTTNRIIRIQLGAPGGFLPTITVDSPRRDVWQLDAHTTWGDQTTLTIPTGRPLRLGIRPAPPTP
jgi:hypothetical protein